MNPGMPTAFSFCKVGIEAYGLERGFFLIHPGIIGNLRLKYKTHQKTKSSAWRQPFYA